MAIIHLEDWHFPLDDAIATDDKKLFRFITPNYPHVVKSEIDRQTCEGKLQVYIKPTSETFGEDEKAGNISTPLEGSSRGNPTAGIPSKRLHYKAVCWIKARYLPSSEDFTTGSCGVKASANYCRSVSSSLLQTWPSVAPSPTTLGRAIVF